MPVAAVLAILFAAQGPQPAAPVPTEVQGVWEAKPLVTKSTADPAGSGAFLEFGDTYVTDSFLAFWARTDPQPREGWALYSWKDGKLIRVLKNWATVAMPDTRKVSIVRTETPIHAGKSLLYFSPTMPDHVYAWDGEKFLKVLANGDELAFRDAHYTIKRARVLDAGAGGKALVYWDSSKQHANGWALHDTSGFTPLWMEGDELPGIPGVRIENLSAGNGCYSGCVPPARLLEDGSVLASVKVTEAGAKRFALFRFFPGKAQEILADSSRNALLGNVKLGQILAASPRAFVMDGTLDWVRSPGINSGTWKVPQFVFFDGGRVQVADAKLKRELDAINVYGPVSSDYQLDGAILLGPESPRALVTTRVARVSGWNNTKMRTFPGLSFWDGQKLSAVAWEEALGLTITAAEEQLQKHSHHWSSVNAPMGEAALIGLRAIPGPMGGVSVRLPLPVDAPRNWFVPADSVDGKLQPPPRFSVAGQNLTLADVLVWRGPDEALAGTADGFFLLTRGKKTDK